ncbi:MAG TPA: hypothetical protein VFI10_01550 [Gaiellaceae bacterium]|nr:hypothetical protein [Gaiellaceae bacterium]
MSVTLCCLSGGAPRLGALLELCRDAVDEIVVALDDRADLHALGRVPELADRLLLVPFEPPVERTLPWLYAQCRGSWILRLDDDEVPSQTLLDELAELATGEVTHVWLPRRWLHPDARTYLDAHPWAPDFQLRLSVNDARLVRFPGITHVPLEVAGAARYARAPLYHLDLLRPYDERRAKAERYEAARPGLRAAGRALNHALYLPEDAPEPPRAAVPAGDARLVAAVLDAPSPPRGERPAAAPSATRADIDSLWGRAPLDAAPEVVVLRAPETLEACERAQVEVLVRNRASAPLLPPAVQLSASWRGLAPGPWTPLPNAITGGGEAVVVAALVAPAAAGRHVLEVDVVHGDRLLGAAATADVEVVPRRRIGVFVRDATRDRGAALVTEIARLAPALEPVVVGGDGGGYAAVPGPEREIVAGLRPGRRRLRSFAAAAARSARPRSPLELDALVLAGLEATTLLERFADLAVVRLAAAAGARILVPRPPPARNRLDALLLARLLRTRGVEVGDAAALPAFLALHSPEC